MTKPSAAELIRAIRAEEWEPASAAITGKHLSFNAAKYLTAKGKATWFSGVWFQGADYLQSYASHQPSIRQLIQHYRSKA